MLGWPNDHELTQTRTTLQLASWATSLSLDFSPDFQVLIRGSARLDHRVRWWLEGRGAARDEKENSVKKLYKENCGASSPLQRRRGAGTAPTSAAQPS